MGERVLCKHEVVGSIPSGSTRWLIAKILPCRLEALVQDSFAKSFMLFAGYPTS